ncbi:MAG: signal peptidase I, partial [Patescibacteria group bacterium]
MIMIFLNKKEIWEFAKLIVVSLLIIIPVRFYIAQPFIVSGNSMDPSFLNGDYLIIDEISYQFKKPERGEVVVFRYPLDPSKFFIKRIIGLPGETVRIQNGAI